MIIDLFFTLFNFGILVVLVAYAVRHFLVPQMREKIIDDINSLANLKNEHHRLKTDHRSLEESISQQEDSAKYLFKKINRWRNAVDLEHEARNEDDKNLLNKANEKVQTQLHQYVRSKAYDALAPQVYKKLKTDLEKSYADSRTAHEYIATVLDDLKELKQ